MTAKACSGRKIQLLKRLKQASPELEFEKGAFRTRAHPAKLATCKSVLNPLTLVSECQSRIQDHAWIEDSRTLNPTLMPKVQSMQESEDGEGGTGGLGRGAVTQSSGLDSAVAMMNSQQL